MKNFRLRADLAAGLTHRLSQLDPSKIAETLGGKPSAAVRSVQKVVAKIERQNGVFMKATGEIYDKKVRLMTEENEKFKAAKKGKTDEEAAAMFIKLRETVDAKSAEIQKTSTAKPDEVIEFSVSNDEYDKVIGPLFELTSSTWADSQGNNGQRNFLDVADALEGIEPEEPFDTVLRTDNHGNA